MSRFPFGFAPRQAKDVERGRLRITMRPERADAKYPQPGDRAMLYEHLRTTNARLLNEGKVTRCRHVLLNIDDREAIVDGVKLDAPAAHEFAQQLGFESRARMFEFYGHTHGVVFRGFAVEWEPVHVGVAA